MRNFIKTILCLTLALIVGACKNTPDVNQSATISNDEISENPLDDWFLTTQTGKYKGKFSSPQQATYDIGENQYMVKESNETDKNDPLYKAFLKDIDKEEIMIIRPTALELYRFENGKKRVFLKTVGTELNTDDDGTNWQGVIKTVVGRTIPHQWQEIALYTYVHVRGVGLHRDPMVKAYIKTVFSEKDGQLQLESRQVYAEDRDVFYDNKMLIPEEEEELIKIYAKPTFQYKKAVEKKYNATYVSPKAAQTIRQEVLVNMVDFRIKTFD
jgi:hypothetical protein